MAAEPMSALKEKLETDEGSRNAHEESSDDEFRRSEAGRTGVKHTGTMPDEEKQAAMEKWETDTAIEAFENFHKLVGDLVLESQTCWP